MDKQKVMTKVEKNSTRKGGRAVGTPNKRTSDLLDIANRLDCNPFEVLILFAKGDYAALGYEEKERIVTKDSIVEKYTITPELRQRSAKDACEYLHPKRKAVEHTFNPNEMNDDELIAETAKVLIALKGEK